MNVHVSIDIIIFQEHVKVELASFEMYHLDTYIHIQYIYIHIMKIPSWNKRNKWKKNEE